MAEKHSSAHVSASRRCSVALGWCCVCVSLALQILSGRWVDIAESKENNLCGWDWRWREIRCHRRYCYLKSALFVFVVALTYFHILLYRLPAFASTFFCVSFENLYCQLMASPTRVLDGTTQFVDLNIFLYLSFSVFFPLIYLNLMSIDLSRSKRLDLIRNLFCGRNDFYTHLPACKFFEEADVFVTWRAIFLLVIFIFIDRQVRKNNVRTNLFCWEGSVTRSAQLRNGGNILIKPIKSQVVKMKMIIWICKEPLIRFHFRRDGFLVWWNIFKQSS